MPLRISPNAGMPATTDRLVAAYHAVRPDPTVPAQRVAFGTSGHRGCALDASFNEWHVLAITQAICEQRRRAGILGPLYLGLDTHALSAPAGATVLSVLAANGVDVMRSANDEVTPTPAVSRAIVTHNRARGAHRADGIIVTPSHNPPRDGGLKYNPPHGGPAGERVTGAIQAIANAHLEAGLRDVRRLPAMQARRAATTHRHDFRTPYVAELDRVIDLAAIRRASLRMGVDPMGGAGVHYWGAIAERWRLDLTVISEVVDPTFAFMSRDWDGLIRMDPSSPYAMRRLVALADRFDIAFACDTDHDRHGIVTRDRGLLPPDHYLCAAIDHLFRHRPQWDRRLAIGKTVVSTRLIDHIAARLDRRVFEVPVGFKWFAPGLADGSLGFAGEESAGAAFLQRDGATWTSDKDGIAAALLSAEITAVTGRDPGAHYAELAARSGCPVARRVEATATPAQRRRLAAVSSRTVAALPTGAAPAGTCRDRAPGNGAPIGGLRIDLTRGWFTARPSGTEDLYRIHAESFVGPAHLETLLQQAQDLVDRAIGPP